MARKPEGGFSFISVVQLLMVWWAYDTGRIRFLDLRSYFACWELLARRCGLARGRTPEFGPLEVHRLTGGGGGEHTRHSLRRLEAAGLLTFSETAIRFAESPDGMPGDLAGFWALLAKVENHRRKVPVPRRVVRFLAHGAGRVVTATVLGHLLRCLYYRSGLCKPLGNCKASWVEDVFGVNGSNVKAARQHLTELGLFVQVPMPQWHRNRWGARVAVNLAWEGPRTVESSGGVVEGAPQRSEAHRSDPRPPGGLSTTGPRPPCLNQKPLPEREYNNQELGSARPAGVSGRGRGEEKPTIRHVVLKDLTDTGRLLELHRQAVLVRLATDGERGRLQFVSQAEHARTFATKNPSGLFVSNLKHRRYGFINQTDEDHANRRIKEHLYGDTRTRPSVGPPVEKRPETPPLSELARYVLATRRVVGQQRVRLDPFTVAKRHRPMLTREEWETGHAELEHARCAVLQSPHEMAEDE